MWSKEGMKEGWEEVNRVLYYQSLPYVLEVIHTELISWHYDEHLVDHFGIEKIWELIAQK